MAADKDVLGQLLESVQRYVRQRLLPLEQQVDREDRIPDEIVEEMREIGLFGLSIPKQYGGLGLSMSEEVLIAQELGYTSPAFLVDADLPGIELGKPERKMGLRGSDVCDVVLTDVKVPRSALIVGGSGYIADYNVERFYLDVRLFRLYEGTSQIQQLIIARSILRNL